MPTNIKGLLVGILAVLTFVSVIGIGVAIRKDDHAYEIKLLQNTRIGEGFAGPQARAPQASGGFVIQPGAQQRRPEATSEDVMAVGYTLMADKNPAVRSRSADTFGRIAATENRGSIEYGPREAQMIDLMQAAYHSEQDERVRCQIVTNAQAFNHPQADELITLALNDPAASVRGAADKAKHEREKRLVVGGSGNIQQRVWR